MTLARVIGVRFKRSGKVYYFDPGELDFLEGDGVVVETSRGVDYGEVTMRSQEISDQEVVVPLKPVMRKGTQEDRQQVEDNLVREREAMVIGAERIAAQNLDMRLVDVEYAFDGKKITFYFTSDDRVDFRELVRDLASRFHTRIELRQIGVRDEARMLGGLGPCGRPVCCKTFMSDFIPVSIRMAKEQNISLNPTKISGLCGRLMCCLEFEHENYVQARKEMPKLGATAMTPDGPGEVVDMHLLKETVKVHITLPDTSMDQREYAVTDIQLIPREEYEQALRQIEEHKGEFPVRVNRTPRSPREAQLQTEAKNKSAERSAQLAENKAEPAERGEPKAEKKEAPKAAHEEKKGAPHHNNHRPNTRNHPQNGENRGEKPRANEKPVEKPAEKPVEKKAEAPARKPIKIANLDILDAMNTAVEHPQQNQKPQHGVRRFGNKNK